ncbi:MAG: DUF2271 domain-containing protein [Bacteroidota bacterium]
MKKISTLFTIAIFIAFGLKSFAQTAGTMAFNVTTASPSGAGTYSPKHVVAVWIEDANGVFVKTLLRQAVARKQYLATWITKSAENVVDATTGATLANHTTPLALTWNGKDVNQTLVADGTYKVGIQMAWSNTAGPVSYFTFTKGATANTGVTTATTNYTAMSLTWTPTTTNVEDNETSSIMVYPNPASNMLNINLGSKAEDTKLEMYNVNGQVVVSKNYSNASGILNVNINDIAEGVYFVSVKRNSGDIKTKIIVKK